MVISKSSSFDSLLSLQVLMDLPQGVAGFKTIRNAGQKLVDLAFIFLNATGEGILGRSAGELMGSTLLKHFPDHQPESFFNRLAGVIESGKPETVEYILPDAAGYPKWIKAHCSQLEDGLLVTFEDISLQRKLEEQLHESQQFVQSITETSPEIIYVYDLRSGRNVYINQRMAELLGYPISDTHLADIFTLVHPEDKAKLEAGFGKLSTAADNEIIEDEYRLRTANGSWRWILNRMVVFRRGPEGYVWQIVGSARDITKRKRMDDELQQQQHLIASIADATPDIIMLMDLIENRVVYVNRQFVNNGGVAGVRLAPEKEADRAQLVLQEDLLKRTAYLKGFAEAHNNEIREVEYRMKDSRGQWRWYWIRGKVFRRLPDNRVWQVILMGQDMTPQKEAQRQLKGLNEQLKARQEELHQLNNDLENRVRDRTRELEESSRRLRNILESLPQMAWTALPDGQINYYNQRWYDYTGLTPASSFGTGWRQVFHPEDIEATVQRWQESLTTGKEYYFENRVRRCSDGEWRWHIIRAAPITDENGKISLWIGTYTDFHDLKMALENLSTANAALDSFVHMAAHDLKSPVSNLKSLLQLLRHTKEPAEADQFVAAIEASALRLDNTIEGLVEILGVQTSYEIPARQVNFQQVVDLLLLDFTNELARFGGEVITDFGDCSSIYYVEAYINSIIRNLLSNAIKYRSADRKLKIKIGCQRSGEFIVVTVRDNGIGMDLKQHRKELFKPFTRLTTQAHGKGLGLHLMKNMIERNGGKIQVESEPNAGTAFRIFLKEYELVTSH